MPGTYILDRSTLEPKAFLEDYNKIQWTRSFFKEGSFTLSINFNQFNARQIEKGDLIGIAETPAKAIDHVFLIEQVELSQARNVADEMLMISGRDIGGMLQERLLIPEAGNAYVSNLGPSESLMKFFVNVSMGPGADAERQIPNFVVATDQGRQGVVGVDFEYEGRFQVLFEAIEEISRFSQLGWEVFFNANDENFVFDVIPGVDRTIGTGTNPVIFDFEFESILEQTLMRTDLDRKTFAWVGGDGEGATRDIVETFIASSEPTGFDRREVFVDAQDQVSTDILSVKGDAELRKTDIDDVIEIDINTFGPFSYRTDYDLGDIITIRNRKWNFEKDMRIVDITLEITPERPRPKVVIAMDKPLPQFKSKLKKTFEQFQPARRI